MKIIIFLFVIILSLHAAELKKVSLQLQYFHQFQFAGYYVAKEKGYYKDVGLELDIKEFKVGVNPVDEVVSGRADFAIGRSALISERASGKKIVALASILQSTPSVMITKKSSGLNKIEDFHGKKISILGTEKSDSIHVLLLSKKISFNDMEVVVSKDRFNQILSDEVDIITGYTTNQPFFFKELGIDINIFDPKDYGFDFYSEIIFTSEDNVLKNEELVSKFVRATLKGWQHAFRHLDNTVELILQKYNTQNKSKKSLLFEAEALKKLAYYKTDELGHIDYDRVLKIYDMYRIMGLVENKTDLDKFIFHDDTHLKINYLTDDEKHYLEDNTNFTFLGGSNLLPFEGLDKENGYIGIVSDYLNYLEEKLDIKIKREVHSSVVESENIADIVSADMSDDTLYEKYEPIDAFIENPVVIVMKDDSGFISNLNYISDKKIAIVKNHPYLQKITTKYSELEFHEVDNIQDGLLGVGTGKYEALLDSLSLIDYAIKEHGYDNLEIAGKTDISMNMTLFIDKNKPLLHDIIDKVIKQSDEYIHKKISAKWKRDTREVTDYRLVWQLISLFAMIFTIVIFFMIRQNRLSRVINEQKEMYENIYQKSTDGILLLEDNKFTDCNEAVVNILGYSSKEEFLNTYPWELSPQRQPDGRLSSEKSKDMDAIAYKDGSNCFEWLHKKANGENIWIEVVLTKININNKDLLHVVWRDIQRKKELEEEILQINENLAKKVQEEVQKNVEKENQLLHQSRLAQMGEMISMIAHQWRQPLAAIASAITNVKLKIMMNDYDLSKEEDQKEYGKYINTKLNDVESYVMSLSNTIDDFRNFYRIDKELHDSKINEPIEKALKIIGSTLNNNNIKVEEDYSSKIELSIYISELMQVLLNIIQNSKDNFLERNTENPTITISTYDEEDSAVLKICDNGGGISEDIIDKVFDPYFSTKIAKNGTGLGLYMSKLIVVEHHLGKLDVENTKDGVCFTIRLKNILKAK